MNKGFTIFFAVLVASLALSVGLAIYDLTIRDLSLSSTVTQSQYALYSADSGSECALYWDAKYTGNSAQTGFATSSDSVNKSLTPGAGSNTLFCNGQDITAAAAAFTVTQTSSAATTTFTLTFPPQPYCATVVVSKYTDPSGTPYTSVISHGFKTCVPGAPLRLERALQVSY